MTVPWSFSQTTSMTSSSTTASSPSPNSTPPNFTDWLHISPAPQSTVSPMMVMMSPFQDLSSSARINLGLQEPDHCLHYLYNISDFLRFNKTPASVIPTCLSPPAIFNSHHGMLSLDSTTTTLVDPPSPDSLALFPSTVPAVGHQSHTPQFLPSSTSLFASSASKFNEDRQTSVSPFGNYFGDSAAPFASLPLEDISPVVRADPLQESQAGPNKLSSGPKKLRNRNRRNHASYFVQKLHSVPSPAKTLVPSTPDLLEEPIFQRLLSPCKLVPSTSNNISVDNRAVLDIPASPPDVSGSFTVAPLPLVKAIAEQDIVSPLTPLTPLSSSPGLSPPTPPPPLKIVIKLKRRSMDEFPTTPPRRSKRSRRTILVDKLSPITDQSSSSPLTELSPEFNPTNPQNHRRPVYTNRKLPPTIEISANYPLFYRRFPASRHFQMDDSEYISLLLNSTKALIPQSL